MKTTFVLVQPQFLIRLKYRVNLSYTYPGNHWLEQYGQNTAVKYVLSAYLGQVSHLLLKIQLTESELDLYGNFLMMISLS